MARFFLSSLSSNLIYREKLDTSHPVFHRLSDLNGKINKMTLDTLKGKLKEFGIDTSGSLESCRKRLKHACKYQILKRALDMILSNNYDCICVIDFEATCEENEKNLIQEIIQFPAFLIDVQKRKIVSSFHEYVKPVNNYLLSEYCKKLTNIKQSDIDKASHFVEVLPRFEDWLASVIRENNFSSFALLTDGPLDFAYFFAFQCKLSQISYPLYAKQWINLKKLFVNYYKIKSKTTVKLSEILEYLGLNFLGNLHNGYDDALNMARIVIRMLVDGANPIINERISWHKENRRRFGDHRFGFVKVTNNNSNELNFYASDEDNDS